MARWLVLMTLIINCGGEPSAEEIQVGTDELPLAPCEPEPGPPCIRYNPYTGQCLEYLDPGKSGEVGCPDCIYWRRTLPPAGSGGDLAVPICP